MKYTNISPSATSSLNTNSGKQLLIAELAYGIHDLVRIRSSWIQISMRFNFFLIEFI